MASTIVKSKSKPKPLSSRQEYLIHDNGGRPFKVVVSGDTVTVHGERALLRTFKSVKQTFVGKSPKNKMTEFSGGHGPEYDGNSILLYLGLNRDTHEYVYIGSEIYSFRSHDVIVDYVSPVGNSDVPYPYGIDQAGKYYMMLDAVVIALQPLGEGAEPYVPYYDNKHTSMRSFLSKKVLVPRQ